MKFPRRVQTLVILLLALLLAAPALAQRNKTEKRDPLYPDAVRVEPKKANVQQRFNRKFEQISKLADDDKYQELVDVALEIVNDPKAKPADIAAGYQNAVYGAMELEDYDSAAEYMEKAIETNALSNDTHYQMMLQLAQIHMSEERYVPALEILDRFMEETRSRKPDHLALKGNALYRLERFDEAATVLSEAIRASDKPQPSWQQLLMAAYFDQEKPEEAARVAEELMAANPDDKRAAMNLVSIYAQADQYDKAAALLEKLRAKGALDEERDYRQLYVIYLNQDGGESKAIDVINEGLAKGILKENAEVFTALAQSYYFTDRFDEAIEAYRKAAPLAKDGEASLNLARVLSNEEHFAESKAAAQQAIARGVRRPGDAWMIIARAEFGLDNRSAMIAAYREAAKYPESQEQAREWLRRSGQL
ncbi:MAG: tetratricopeptide repeat protein [Lysobacteraceae bacterium]